MFIAFIFSLFNKFFALIINLFNFIFHFNNENIFFLSYIYMYYFNFCYKGSKNKESVITTTFKVLEINIFCS